MSKLMQGCKINLTDDDTNLLLDYFGKPVETVNKKSRGCNLCFMLMVVFKLVSHYFIDDSIHELL